MNNEALQGYLAYWKAIRNRWYSTCSTTYRVYDNMHDVPNMWIIDPTSGVKNLNLQLASGWQMAAYECDTGVSIEMQAHPTFGIMKVFNG